MRAEPNFLLTVNLTLWCETETLVQVGERGRATEDVLRFGKLTSNRRYRIPYLRALAVLARSRGGIDAAMGSLSQKAGGTVRVARRIVADPGCTGGALPGTRRGRASLACFQTGCDHPGEADRRYGGWRGESQLSRVTAHPTCVQTVFHWSMKAPRHAAHPCGPIVRLCESFQATCARALNAPD